MFNTLFFVVLFATFYQNWGFQGESGIRSIACHRSVIARLKLKVGPRSVQCNEMVATNDWIVPLIYSYAEADPTENYVLIAMTTKDRILSLEKNKIVWLVDEVPGVAVAKGAFEGVGKTVKSYKPPTVLPKTQKKIIYVLLKKKGDDGLLPLFGRNIKFGEWVLSNSLKPVAASQIRAVNTIY